MNQRTGIPGFELGQAEPLGSPILPSQISSPPSSRHSSFSSKPSDSVSVNGNNSRRSSDAGEKKVDIVLDESMPSGGISSDDANEIWDEAGTSYRYVNLRTYSYPNE